jgi:hypothetical protein
MPSGWGGGGIHTLDIYADGTMAAGINGSINAYMNDYAGGTVNGGGQTVATSPNGANYVYQAATNGGAETATNGTVISQNGGNYAAMTAANNNTPSSPEIYTNGIIDAGNGVGAGSYFGMYNGSWWANNAGNSTQSGNTNVQGQTATGNLYISGSTGTNNPSGGNSGYLGFVQSNIEPGWGCGGSNLPATRLSADPQGQILQCVAGTWQFLGGLGAGPYYFSLPTWNGSSTGEQIPGTWVYCAMASVGTTGKNDGENFNDGVTENGPGSWYMWGEAVTAACYQ